MALIKKINQIYTRLLKSFIILYNLCFKKNIDAHVSLKSELLKFLNAPSKHIRPIISILYLKALNIDIDEKQILYQAAIELVHNASLIHDDVIDESELRRGKNTLNNKFNSKLAVITGDYLLSDALNKVIKIGRIELIQMFSDTLDEMSEGEINQQFSKFTIPSLNDYIKKSEQKTAKLFETALCGSLLIADFKYDGLDFAKNFGIAFQIRDDLINCKTTNSDIKDGIYTAPVIFAGGTKINDDAIEKTQTLLNNYIESAKNNLSNIEDNEYKQALCELLELFKNE